MTPIELAIYAGEMKLLMVGLASLAAIFFAAALLFAFFFGTVSPRLRRAHRHNRRLRADNSALRDANHTLKVDLSSGAEKIVALENAALAFDKEIKRLDRIRKRTDSSLVETKELLERLQSMTAHVDVPIPDPVADPEQEPEPGPMAWFASAYDSAANDDERRNEGACAPTLHRSI